LRRGPANDGGCGDFHMLPLFGRCALFGWLELVELSQTQ
jgi:hypothetical protein